MGDRKQVKEMYHQLILSTIKYCTGGTELSSLYLYSNGVNNDSN